MEKHELLGMSGEAAGDVLAPGGDADARGDTGRTRGAELPRGTSVGRYLLLALVGRGGMGEVYAAYDPELDRKIALKLLRAQTTAGVDPSEGRARLLREAQAIARLSDPNVVVVFDVGTFHDRVFLAMEFVDGHTVGYWMHAASRGWRDVVKTFTAAGKGLASAHRAGVIHRDFKPDNVMIGHDGKVRVMDFGLARTIEPGEPPLSRDPSAAGSDGANMARPTGAITPKPKTPGLSSGPSTGGQLNTVARTVSLRGPGATPAARQETAPESGVPLPPTGGIASDQPPRTLGAFSAWIEDQTETRDLLRGNLSPIPHQSPPHLTEEGAMMGTPAYMAPEQFEGKQLDERTDQFSFCIAVYEGLYGQRPFEGKNIQQLTANVLGGRVREPPANARVPGWLRRVVLRGLRVDPAQRHASMDALLLEMGRDPGRTGRRWTMMGLGLSLIVVLGGQLVRVQRQQRQRCVGGADHLAGVWELPSARGLSPRKEFIRSKFMATGKRYAADSFVLIAKELDRYVVEWTKMHRDACEATNVRGEQSAEVLDLRMSCLTDRFAEVRALTNVFSGANGDVVAKSVEAVHSIRSIDPCADITALRAVVKPPDNPLVRKTVADVRDRLAGIKAEANAGRYKAASQHLSALTPELRTIKYQPVLAEVAFQTAELQSASGEFLQSEKTYEEAVWLAEESRHDEVVVAATSQLIFVVGYFQARYLDGDRWARHAAAALGRLGPGHEVIAGWRANNMGLMFEKQGRFEESLVANLEAVALKKRVLGDAHFDVAISQANVATALFKLGRIDEAIEFSDRGLAVLRAALGSEHPQVAIALVNAAEIKHAQGRPGEARALAEQAVAIWGHESEPNHPMLAYALTTIGESLLDEGQYDRAIPPLERALRIRELNDPQVELLAETRFALARAAWAKDRARAMTLAEQASVAFATNRLTDSQGAAVNRWIAEHRVSRRRVGVR